MTLKEQIMQDFMSAMKEQNIIAKNILWNIKTEIIIQEKIKEVSDIEILQLIQKEVKKLDATINFEWIKNELKIEADKQKLVLVKYLPEQLTDAEVLNIINTAILNWEIEKNVGSIMKFAKNKFQWQFDMKKLSDLIKSII